MADFDYKVINKTSITVIVFSGKLTKESLPQLENCRKGLTTISPKTLVLHFKNITGVEHTTFRELTMLQQDIRKSNIELYVTGLDSQNKQLLLEKAVIRLSETRKGLEEILGSL